MLLIDSDYERQTLAQLRSVQSWLRRRCGVLTTIDKPLFDLRPPASTDDAPRPPLIPDFLVGVVGPGGVRRNVVVETPLGPGRSRHRRAVPGLANTPIAKLFRG